MKENYELIFNQAELLYNVKLIRENTMGGSGNKIFEVKTEQELFILRVSEFNHKTKERVELETQWIDHLAKKCDNVAKPICSVNKNLYEIVEAGEKSYILCLFERALGRCVDSSNPDEFNEQLYFNLGAIMGDMHRLTANYQGNVIKPEFEWDNDTYSWRGDNIILDEDVRQWERKYLDEMHTLPKSKDTYGIVHFDIHIDNFFVNNNKIKLFDFYDCQFNWYAADIASAIFFMVQKGAGPMTYKSEKERTEFAEAYIISYLKGYLQTNSINEFWIDKLDLFMKYQMTDEYRCAQNFWKPELMHLQQWYLDWHKERIINNLPFVNVDYKKVINSIPLVNTIK